MYQPVTRTSIHLLVTVGALATGCFQSSNLKDASGSNWLTCRKVQDCESDKAVICDSEGYCLDKEGERIAAELLDGDEALDAGADPPDAGEIVTNIDADNYNESNAGDNAVDSGIPTTALCAWGVSDILAAASLVVPDRVYCDFYGSGDVDRTPGVDCFFEAIEAGTAAQISISNDLEGGVI